MMPRYRYDSRKHVKVAILLGIVFAIAMVVLMMWPNHHIVSAQTCREQGIGSCAAPLAIRTQDAKP